MGITAQTGSQIRNFWPDNTEDTIFISHVATISEIIEIAQDHFGDRFDIQKITIEPVHIHTLCIDYDIYDPTDYTNFLEITLKK